MDEKEALQIAQTLRSMAASMTGRYDYDDGKRYAYIEAAEMIEEAVAAKKAGK